LIKIETCSTVEEKKILFKKYHDMGFRMMEDLKLDDDNFQLTFSDENYIIEDDFYLFEKELLQKLDSKEINLDGIKELLKIKFGQESYIPPKTLLEKLRFWN